MDTTARGASPASAAQPAVRWECADCGHANVDRVTCEACGLARHYLEDPALDLPFRPRLQETSGFWLGLSWSVAALAGLVLLLMPDVRERTGIGLGLIVPEVALSGYAAVSSFLAAVWERWFNQFDFVVPPHSATGTPFEVNLTLVPYDTMNDVSIDLRLVDNFYTRSGDSGVETKSRDLGSERVLRSGRLRGRRANVFSVEFLTPFPATKHSDVMADIMADVLDVIGLVVPAVRWNARNLREHGGYYVEATVRVGLIPRRLKKRVIAYHIGEQIYLG